MLRRIFARKRIDITWSDIWIFIWRYLTRAESPSSSESEIERLWCPGATLATFTVRSGFDMCLQACAFPPGSEVIVSAVTIQDMVRIIEYHKLVPVAVDIQEDGSVSAEDVEALITSKTKAILIAHLFGNRMPFEGIVNVAKRGGAFVFEDCAEAFCGTDFIGHPDADVSMFSFGLIKTATAFGGAILTIRDPSLLNSIKTIQTQYPLQYGSKFWLRVAKYCVFKALTDSALLYGAFLGLLYLRGFDHHTVIRELSRSFVPENLMRQIRRRPSLPLLQLLRRRVATFESDHLASRLRMVEHLSSLLPRGFKPIGYGQKYPGYWLCPIRVLRPDILIDSLYRAGFDAADGGTSLAVVTQNSKVKPKRAENMIKHVVYLPIDHCYDEQALHLLARVIWLHKNVYGNVLERKNG